MRVLGHPLVRPRVYSEIQIAVRQANWHNHLNTQSGINLNSLSPNQPRFVDAGFFLGCCQTATSVGFNVQDDQGLGSSSDSPGIAPRRPEQFHNYWKTNCLSHNPPHHMPAHQTELTVSHGKDLCVHEDLKPTFTGFILLFKSGVF